MEVRDMNKVVAVTGAFGTLGSEVGRAFSEAGWKVALIDMAAAPPPGLQKEFGEHLLLGGVNLTDSRAADEAIGTVLRHYGHLHALINVAGGFRWETLADGDLATWDLMYQMNVRTAATAIKAAHPYLVRTGRGSIVNIGSASAVKAGAGMGAYAASKSGVMRLTEALAEEFKAADVRVNAVLPGVIDTPQNRKDMPDADFSAWVQPADIAQVIVFLASDGARAITGALIPVTAKL